jgi:aspartyl-tRNA(Asn)/glutamyl-tRNA(Gln) amidotransferase subunit B
MKYEPVIGLEVHIHLLTQSKIFCRCSTQFGAEGNTQVCPICLGLPGVLPVLNKKAVDCAIMLALATNSTINHKSIFARKNYFYPDLPKGYQISQFEEPFCVNGRLTIASENGQERDIRIHRIHLEEDAGKSMHAEAYVSKHETLIDVNRCGVPLLEIVSEPDLRTPKEAYDYLYRMRQIVRYLGISDGNMEEGSLRCDANVSVRPVGTKALGVKTELKNMNSFSAVEKALEAEIERQIAVLEQGGEITQQTLLWHAANNAVEPMRSKEESHDYRYFPEPDLVPLEVSQEWIDDISKLLPELPDAKKKRFMEEYQLPEYDAAVLTDDLAVAEYYEHVAASVKDKKSASNWVMGEVLRAVKETGQDIRHLPVTPHYLVEILEMVGDNTLSSNMAKKVFDLVLKTAKPPKKIVEEERLQQISDSGSIEVVIDKILSDHPGEVQAFLSGKDKLIGFFVGQTMRATSGKANPKSVNEILCRKLAALKE